MNNPRLLRERPSLEKAPSRAFTKPVLIWSAHVIEPSDSSTSASSEAAALFKRAQILASSSLFERAIPLLNQAVEFYSHPSAVYNNLGVCFYNLKKIPDAVLYFDKALQVSNLGQSPPAHTLRALLNKGVALESSGYHESAFACFDEAIRRFHDNQDLRGQIAIAFYNKSFSLHNLNRDDEAVAVLKETIERFGEDSENYTRLAVARALKNISIGLRDLGRSDDALKYLDESVIRFGLDEDPSLRSYAAEALVEKGEELHSLGQYENAISCFDEVINNFDHASSGPNERSLSFPSEFINDKLNSPLRSIKAFEVVGEIAEGSLAPGTKELPLSLEIETLIQRHGYTAVSQEIAARSPSPAPALTPTPLQAKAVLKNSTLGKLLQRYEELLDNIELPANGFETLEQARLAARLSSTYHNLRKEQIKLGFEPSIKDDRVTEAERLRADFYRNQEQVSPTAPIRTRRLKKPAAPK